MAIIGNFAVDRIKPKKGYDFSRSLFNLRQRVIQRIFVRGKDILNNQMSKAQRNNLNREFQYRYDTGELKNSTRVFQVKFNELELSFKRDENILRFLTQKYGRFLGWGIEETQYLVDIANKQNIDKLKNLFNQ